ncbi:MAG: triose-phosphate isomerase [Candidatus Shapirobacteria bacterium]
MIIVNFKIYPESFADGAIKLAKICQSVSQKTGIKIIPSVSPLDCYRLGLPSLLQHVDNVTSGPFSGYISAQQSIGVGAIGTLLNHSEHQLKPGTISQTLKNLPSDFISVLCIQSLGQALTWAKKLKPTYFAYEPKELIGNKHQSVATVHPEAITNIAQALGKIPLLVGAGIHSKSDVVASLKLGAVGILVASDVVTSDDPESHLLELAQGFKV